MNEKIITIKKEITVAKASMDDLEYQRAADILNAIIERYPASAEAYYQVGLVLEQVGNELGHTPSLEKGLHYLHKAIALDPSESKYSMAVSEHHLHKGEREKALRFLYKAVAKVKDQAALYLKMADIERVLGQTESALASLQWLTKIESENLTYRHLYAKELFEMKQEKEALKVYEELITSDRSDIPHKAFTEWLALYSDHAACLTNIRERITEIHRRNPSHPMTRYLYAKICINKGESNVAIAILKELETEYYNDTDMQLRISNVYASIGLSNRSSNCISKAQENDPVSITVLASEVRQHRYRYGDPQFLRLMKAEAHMVKLENKERVHLHYALGKAYDDLDDLDVAFEHYKKGGALASDGKHLLDIDRLSKLTKFITENFTADLQNQNEEGYVSDKPLFIIGMPRSGTTLLEQVLSSAKGIYGAGELKYMHRVLDGFEMGGVNSPINSKQRCFTETESPDLVQRGRKYVKMLEMLAPTESHRIVDKQLDNFIFAGLIHRILPNAGIIHARRHPVEICLSAYRIHFSDGLHWSNDLKTLGQRYRLYDEMMRYWKKVLPEGRMLEVRYEDMIHDLENTSKGIFDYLGLPWQSECLNFHTAKRAVHTASSGQVHKPIYTSSTGRWHRYEPWLQPLIDEIGDLIEAYETELEALSAS